MRAINVGAGFFGVLLFVACCNAQSISPADAGKYVGKSVTVCGTVASTKYLDRSQRRPTLLNLDKPFPDHIFTAVIYSEDRGKFGEPEKNCRQKRVCVTGEVSMFRDKPQIILKELSQLKGC